MTTPTEPTEPSGTVRTVMFAVTGMHCASCGLLIDDAVEDLPGVTSSTTDTRTGQTTVTASTAAITDTDMNPDTNPGQASIDLAGPTDLVAQVAATIAHLGYHAEPVTA